MLKALGYFNFFISSSPKPIFLAIVLTSKISSKLFTISKAFLFFPSALPSSLADSFKVDSIQAIIPISPFCLLLDWESGVVDASIFEIFLSTSPKLHDKVVSASIGILTNSPLINQGDSSFKTEIAFY